MFADIAAEQRKVAMTRISLAVEWYYFYSCGTCAALIFPSDPAIDPWRPARSAYCETYWEELFSATTEIA
ncbi:hypothetical protein [Glaciimonas immobilis]|uniref:Uncharacterized protein n=1 Tax=Glaciimonas immobilis TaxID=728004 RepID=A0A840RQ05_9BURK|nr:hypothetical protein [Glaciimonas immobilis]MBB5199058.1 hypothetical protein [Glaciimonas immobilis]